VSAQRHRLTAMIQNGRFANWQTRVGAHKRNASWLAKPKELRRHRKEMIADLRGFVKNEIVRSAVACYSHGDVSLEMQGVIRSYYAASKILTGEFLYVKN
jgi:hypothetical protein